MKDRFFKYLILIFLTGIFSASVSAEVTENVTTTLDAIIMQEVTQDAVATSSISTTVPTIDLTKEKIEKKTEPLNLPKEGASYGKYPKLNIEGYKEYEFMKMEKSGDPLQYEGEASYKTASAKILPTAGSSGLLRERLRLDIEGKLSEKLSVSYHLEQEPDLPDKFDIKVRYDKTELTFGDFDAGYKTKEFINFNKAMNGFMLTSYDDWYDFKLVMAKERSTAKEISFVGNGQTVYSLGQTSILEGSVKVYVNDIRVSEGGDYEIDYFDGKIIFRTIKSASDQIVVQYEFTDPIEELIPVATKVDFFGVQGAVRTFEEPRSERSEKAIDKKFIVENKQEVQAAPLPVWLDQNIKTRFGAKVVTEGIAINFQGELPQAIQKVEIKYTDEIIQTLYANSHIQNNIWRGEKILPPGFVLKQAVVVFYTSDTSFAKLISLDLLEIEQIATPAVQDIVSTDNVQLPAGVLSGTEIFAKAGEQGAVFENEENSRLVLSKTRLLPGEKIVFYVYAAKEWENATLKQTEGFKLVSFKREGDLWRGELLCAEGERPGNKALVLVPTPPEIASPLLFKLQVLPLPIVAKQSVFILEGVPVVFGSEDVFLNGKELVPYEDYTLDYSTGELKLQKIEVSTTDDFKVNYRYIENKKIAETFNGKDSQGPYKLKFAPLIRKSVRVFVDGKLLQEGLQWEGKDYYLDYQKGEIQFSLKIDKLKKITVEYAYMLMKEPPKSQKPKEAFYLQTTFLRESADSGDRAEQIVQVSDDTAGGIEVSANGDIILSEATLPLKGVISVQVDGVLLIPASYNVETYRGYIIPTPSGLVPVTASVKVTYEYYKTNVIPFQTYSAGSGMSELIMEDRGARYLPVVYHSEEVYRRWFDETTGLWREDILHPGENYVWGPLITTAGGTILVQEDLEEYWARGYITFVTKNISNVYDTWEIKSGEQIKIKYQYAPGEQPDFGQVSHQVYGVNTQYLINSNWSVGLEAMKSEKSFNRAVLEGSYVDSGTGVYGHKYELKQGGAAVEVVEDSEDVYLNDVLQTRNDDYVIQYSTGILRFKSGINPGVSDNILVNYSYYSQEGVLNKQIREGTAYKANSSVQAGDFTVDTSYMAIDKDFETIGAMRQQPGTKLGDITVAYVPDTRLKIRSFVENRHLYIGSRDNNEPLYKSSYLQKHDGHWEFMTQQTLDIDYQQTDVVQESATVVSQDNTIDTLDRIYGARLNFGPSFFRTLWEEKRSEKYSDFLDRTNLTTTLGTFRHLRNTYKPWNTLSFTTDYQYDNTDADLNPWYVQTINRYQEIIDYLPFPTWRNKIDVSKKYTHKLAQVAPRVSSANETVLTNYFYSTTLTRPSVWTDPFYNEFYLHFNKNYTQDENPLLEQAPNTEDKDNLNFSFRPWDLFKLTRDASRLDSLKGNELDISEKNTHKTTLEEFRPLKLWAGAPVAQDFFIIDRLAYGDSIYNRKNKLSTSTTSGNSTFEEAYDYNVGLRMLPIEDTELKYTYDDSNKQTSYETYYPAYIDNSFTDRPKNKRTYGLAYTPGDFSLAFPFLSPVGLTKVGFWADRTYSTINDETTKYRSDAPTTTVTKKNTKYYEDNQNLRVNPLSDLSLNFKRKDNNDYTVQTGTGTRESTRLYHDLNWVYDTPWSEVQLIGYFTGDQSIQHTAPSLDRTVEELQDDFESRLKRLDERQNYGLAYTPFAQLTLRSSYTNNDIFQEEISGVISGTNQKDDDVYINSKIYSAGAEYRPFSGFSVSYDWDNKQFQEGSGERSTIKAKYQPFDWALGTFIFNYEYVHNSGFGLNEVDQLIAQKNQTGFIATTVGRVKNERMTGSLDLQILNNINSLVVEGTEVVATWTLIRLVDRTNANNNYSVNALYLKGRIIF
ncbi:hypothetical protein ACFL5G_03135 [Candidatus Margulisiibacteriota bacterium]